MSGVAIVIDLQTTAAGATLGRLRAASLNLEPLLDGIGEALEFSTVDRFDTNVAPDGTPWKPSLRVQASGGRTLQLQGHLRDSVHYRVDGDDAVEVGAGGIAKDYAAIHQVGGTITAKGEALSFTLATGAFIRAKSVDIPARPYLGISAADAETIPEIAVDHWRQAMAGGAA